MNSPVEQYLIGLSMTMRNIVTKWIADFSDKYQGMLCYPLGWVDEYGNPYDHPTGKRIRPLLLLMCTDAVGGNWQQALPAAAAVEILHNFSLVHDDIQDDSPTRHGRSTVWKVWGKANAINVGDGLFAISYAALSELAHAGLAQTTMQEIWQIHNRTNLDLVRGQFLDMGFEQQENVTTDEYISMIQGKSAALIAACAQMGALIGSENIERASLFADFGLNLGLAFQIRDDILGIWGDPTVTGKSAATDILTRKKSLPILFGLEKSDELVAIYREESIQEEFVAKAIKILDQVGALDYAKYHENLYFDRAITALDSAKPTEQGANLLKSLSQQLLGRSF